MRLWAVGCQAMKGVRARRQLMAEGLGGQLPTVEDYVNWMAGIVNEWIDADPTGSTTLDEGIHQAVAAAQDLVERALALGDYRVVGLAATAIEIGTIRTVDGEIRCFKGYVDDGE